jgi:hypothetical protein
METLYFFYSEKQKALKQVIAKQNNHKVNINHVVDANGVIHEYTLAAKSKTTTANFDDLVFLCEATMACVISNGFPQGHWAKEHMHKFNLGVSK